MITYSKAPPAAAAATYPAGVASTRRPARISSPSAAANATPARADMARCSSPPTMTWLARIGSFIIAPMPWWPMAAGVAICECAGMGLVMAVWLGTGGLCHVPGRHRRDCHPCAAGHPRGEADVDDRPEAHPGAGVIAGHHEEQPEPADQAAHCGGAQQPGLDAGQDRKGIRADTGRGHGGMLLPTRARMGPSADVMETPPAGL